jgi:SPP1 gp7 family putative phage head morphogenesis protein
MIALRYNAIPKDSMLTQSARNVIYNIEVLIDIEFAQAAKEMAAVIERLSSSSFLLSAAAEAEALGQALDTKTRVSVPRGSAEALSGETFLGNDLIEQIFFILSNIKRKVLQSIEQARILEEPLQDALTRVYKALPQTRRVKTAPKELKRVVKEAESEPAEALSLTFIDDAEWERIVKDYTQKYIPKWRGPETVFDVTSEGVSEEWYGWQVEQLATQEFVDKVRGGQVLAAKQNGINDFQWIAILDDRTDECCAWRDGLTTAEIEQELKGKHRDDECKAIIPPAHFNCRCTLAPMLTDMPDKPASNAQEFDEWLIS